MLQINYIQAYQTIEIIPWWDKKKSQICIPLLVLSLIKNVEKSIHTQHQTFSERIEVQTLFQLSCGVSHHPHLSGPFLCLYLYCLGSGVCLLEFFLLLFLSLSSFSKRKRERNRVGRKRLCNRSCPLQIQLEQKFSVADHFKTDVSFINMQSGGKQRKRKWSHPPKCCEFCSIQRDTFFVLKELKMCQAALAINPRIQPELGLKW